VLLLETGDRKSDQVAQKRKEQLDFSEAAGRLTDDPPSLDVAYPVRLSV
jgi:hypothetical protein